MYGEGNINKNILMKTESSNEILEQTLLPPYNMERISC